MPPTNTKNFLKFTDVSAYYPHQKTKRFEITNAQWGSQLGEIRWYTPWRKYCFYPFDSTIFDMTCLQVIQEKLNQLMQERKHENTSTVGE